MVRPHDVCYWHLGRRNSGHAELEAGGLGGPLKKKKPGPPARLLHFPHSPESNEAIYRSEKGKSRASLSCTY
jgi:hypothetical protein